MGSSSLPVLSDPPDEDEVLAARLFPRDRISRDAYALGLSLEKFRKQGLEQITLHINTAQSLLDALPHDQLKTKARDAAKRGITAGHVFYLIFQQHIHGEPEPSITKAIEAYKTYAFRNSKRYGDGKPLPRSAQTIRNCFDEFRPVVHLWAAFDLADRGLFLRRPLNHRESREDFLVVLGMAKTLGEFATTYSPDRLREPKPIVLTTEHVRVPDSVQQVECLVKVRELSEPDVTAKN